MSEETPGRYVTETRILVGDEEVIRLRKEADELRDKYERTLKLAFHMFHTVSPDRVFVGGVTQELWDLTMANFDDGIKSLSEISYDAGAEEMRQAAIQECYDARDSESPDSHTWSTADYCAAKIKNLPIPEGS